MTQELSREARSLIREALANEQRASGAHRDRLRRRVISRAAAGGVVTLVGSSVAKASARSLFSAVASSLGLGFGAGVVLLGAAQLAFNPSPRAAPERDLAAASRRPLNARGLPPGPRPGPNAPLTVPTPSADAPAPAPAALALTPALVKARTIDAMPNSEASGNSDSSASSALRAELDLMARVQEALRDARGARALELIARYDSLHPSGVLETERLAAEVFAACQIGDLARANDVAARFLARDSSSALATRVKNACPSANARTR